MFFMLKNLGNGFFPEGKLSERNVFVDSFECIDFIPNSYKLIKKHWKEGLVII